MNTKATNYIERILLGGKLKLVVSFVFIGSFCNPAKADSSIEELRFQTRGQPLFLDIDAKKHPFKVDVFEGYNINEQEGEIRRVNGEVPLHTLEKIWQRAIDQCKETVYDLPSPLPDVSPTESECITGKIKRTYCINLIGNIRLSETYNKCNLSEVKKNINKDLGVSIGEKPTEPANKDFDLGALLTYESQIKLGFDGHFNIDPGSIDVDFEAKATLSIDKNVATPGEIVTIHTEYVTDGKYSLITRYPNIDFSFGTFVDAKLNVDLEYAGLDYETAEQIRKTVQIYDQDSINSEIGIIDTEGLIRFVDGEWLGVNISSSGIQYRIHGTEGNLFGKDFYHKTLTVPGIDENLGGAGVVFADIAILSPELDTPVEPSFYCGICEPLSGYVDHNNVIFNSTPNGERELIHGGGDPSWFDMVFTHDGMHDTDLLRYDWDVDFLSMIWGVPLGVKIDGPKVLEVKGKNRVKSFGIKGDMIDFDHSTFWGIDQDLSFDPKLTVIIHFSDPVEVKNQNMTDFELVSQIELLVGESIQFKQPDSEILIKPIYTLHNNVFKNETSLVVSAAIQQTFLSIELDGLYPELAAAAFGLPKQIVGHRMTPQLGETLTVWENDGVGKSLDGFEQIEGKEMSVKISSSTGGGSGDVSGESSGGGGIGFSVLLLFFARRVCEKSFK